MSQNDADKDFFGTPAPSTNIAQVQSGATDAAAGAGSIEKGADEIIHDADNILKTLAQPAQTPPADAAAANTTASDTTTEGAAA